MAPRQESAAELIAADFAHLANIAFFYFVQLRKALQGFHLVSLNVLRTFELDR